MDKRSIDLKPDVYERLSLFRAREAARLKVPLDWDHFFEIFLRRERRKREALSWAYAAAIFVAITWILLWPIYFDAPALIPILWVIGLIVAAVSVYLLTPLALRKYKPFEEAPREILECLEQLANKAGFRKIPLLTISETDEINAMAYCSPHGGRVCLTRGLVNAYEEGKLSLSELEAIIGHEVAHLKHMDNLKFHLALSWVNIFQYLGNESISVGVAMARAAQLGEGLVASFFATIGWLSALMVSGLLLMAKLASALSFHLSRRQEFEADDLAAELTHPGTVSMALAKIDSLSEELTSKELEKLPYPDRWQIQPRNRSWVDRLWDTHPPIPSRVDRQRATLEFLDSAAA